jgi:ParB family chromosome partitioning protein
MYRELFGVRTLSKAENVHAPVVTAEGMAARAWRQAVAEAVDIGVRQSRTVLIEQVVVDRPRRPLDQSKVAEITASIGQVGLLNPIGVVVEFADDGSEIVRLVSGHHRLEAARRAGLSTIECTVLQHDNELYVELAQIDENIMRNEPSPAEHAMLTLRRAEIIKMLAEQDGTVSQFATASKQALRRAGQSTGHDVASVRDQAKRTGESKDKIHRSKSLAVKLGGDILAKIVGSSLDKGVELDAMTKLPEAERDTLANLAAFGEVVSARTADRKPKPKPDRKSQPPTRGKALAWISTDRD